MTCGKVTLNLWKTCGKVTLNLWKTCGKVSYNLWITCGKVNSFTQVIIFLKEILTDTHSQYHTYIFNKYFSFKEIQKFSTN